MGSKPSKPQYQAPQYTELSLPELRTALSKFIGQEGDFQKLQETISSSATKRMDALETLQPGYKAGLTQAQQTADSLAEGNVPADVAQKISQSAAFKGLMTGLPGEQRQAMAARDLGLTSLDLQGRGLAAQQSLRAEANAQMPLQALNLAFSPQYIRQEDVTTATYNNQIKNQQATANANTYNRQQDANYEYDSKYGGSPLGGILGGTLGAGLGAGVGFLASGGNPMGAIAGGGLGMSLGGGIGGSFGGAQGRSLAGVLGGSGGAIADFAGAFSPTAFNNGVFPSVGAAMQAAPYAGGYTPYGEGFVPRATPVSYWSNIPMRGATSGLNLRSGPV